MREHAVNKLDNFIAGWYMDDTSLCDSIIDYHKNSPEKFEGLSNGPYVNYHLKKSTDVKFYKCDVRDSYYKHLQECIDEYIKKYPFCNKYDPWQVLKYPNIQYYKPGEGFHTWHSERVSAHPSSTYRNLVYMTYLNDVTDKGGTEFYHQKITTKAEKGLTLIWPSDWTFTHRSEVSDTQEKYIVTGWMDYYERNEI